MPKNTIGRTMLATPSAAIFISLALTILLAWAPAHASPEAFAQADALLRAGRHAEALALLQPLEASYAGEPRFDALLGAALLETGNPTAATFVLDRAVTVDPGFAGARMDLAIAHFRSDNLEAAEAEFIVLEKQNPPAAARQRIEEYLGLIRTRRQGLRLSHNVFLQAGGGYDSNANSATAIDRFLGFSLDDTARETSSPFAELRAGGELRVPISAGLMLDGRAGLSHRSNPDASFVDSDVLELGVGLRSISEGSTRSVGLRGYRLNSDGRENNSGVALVAGWDYEIRRGLRVGVLGRLGQTRYTSELAIKDVDLWMAGVSARWSLGGRHGANLSGALLFGSDDPVMSESRYGRDLYGLRTGFGWVFSKTVRARISAAMMMAEYDSVFFEGEYDRPREDTLWQTGGSVDWMFKPGWIVSHSINWTRNDTDVRIFDFDRLETYLTLRRVWY